MKLIETVGATSRIWQIFIADSSATNGAGLTGLTNASSGLTCYYHRDTDTTATAVSLVTMTLGTFTSSGFKEIDATNMPGWYQLCPPNAALASGAKSVGFHLKGATNMAPLPIEVQFTGFDLTTATQSVNVSSINSVSASAVTTINANVGTTQPINFTGTGSSALAKVDLVDIAGAAVSTSTAQLGVNVVNIKGTASVGTAGYVAPDYTTVTMPVGVVPSVGFVDNGTLQSATGTTAVIRSAASFADNTLVGHFLWITGGTGVGQSRLITANVNSTDTLTVDTWTTTPDNTSTYAIIPSPPGSATSLTPVNVTAWNGTAVSTPATAGIPDVNIKNINNISAASVTTVNANQGTAQPLNFTGTSTSALVKSDMVDVAGAAVSTSSAQIGVNVINAAGTAWNSGAIQNATFSADTGQKPMDSGTAQAGASTTITLRSGANATNSYYNNCLVVLTGGTGAGQSRFITAYTGASKVATVTAWVTNPDNTTTYVVLPFDAIPGATAPTASQNATAVWQDLLAGADFGTAGSVGALIKANVDAKVSATLQPVTAGNKLAVDASGHASLNWGDIANPSTSVSLSGTTINAVTVTPTTGGLTAQQKLDVENSVWDAVAASHNTSGTTGAKLNSAASAGDPLANPDGTYAPGTVGAKIQNSAQTTTVIQANVKKINDVTITGAGVAGNSFKP